MRRSQTRFPVSPPKRSIFCLEKARACSGLIFQKLKSLVAATRVIDVHGSWCPTGVVTLARKFTTESPCTGKT